MDWLHVLIDSGEFSAFKKREQLGVKTNEETTRFKHVTLDKYVSWLIDLKNTKWWPLVDGAITLDVIGNPEGTFENFKEILSQGIQVVPVYHARASVKYLEYYLEHLSRTELGPQICYGMPRDKDATVRRNVIKEFFDLVDDIMGTRSRFKVKAHALGAMRDEIFEFPFWSCDSRTWNYYGSYDKARTVVVPSRCDAVKVIPEEETPLELRRYDKQRWNVDTGAPWWDYESGWKKVEFVRFCEEMGFDAEEIRKDATESDLLNILTFCEWNARNWFPRLGQMRFYFAGGVHFNTKPTMERRLMDKVLNHIRSVSGKHNVGRLVSYGDTRNYFGVFKTGGRPYAGDMTAELGD